MIAIAHLLAVGCYFGAALLAATPLLKPVGPPLRGVIGALALGVVLHLAGLAAFVYQTGQLPLTGLGPALSLAGLLLAATLLIVEVLARDTSLTLVAAPLAALPTVVAAALGLAPGIGQGGLRGAWLGSHIALSFVGIAAFATAGAAGLVYLIERRELKSRRFGALFRLFPPLATLDRVNHIAAIIGWMLLTLGIVLAVSYSIAYQQRNLPQILWGTLSWLGVSAIVLGRTAGGWEGRRAALYSASTTAGVFLLYVALRAIASGSGKFL
jgi:HemX protein